MTVKELREVLNDFDDNALVMGQVSLRLGVIKCDLSLPEPEPGDQDSNLLLSYLFEDLRVLGMPDM